MNVIGKVLMGAVVSGALVSMAAMHEAPASPLASTNRMMGTGTNGPGALSNTNAWRRSADEAAAAGQKAADTTRDTLKKAGDTTKDAVQDAGRAVERTGERMQ